MSLRIHEFVRPTGWGCGPSAVRAITGASVEDVQVALGPALEKDNRDPNALLEMLPRHVAAALIALEFDIFDKRPGKTKPFAARNVNTPIINPQDGITYPTIKRFVAENDCNDVIMGIASRMESGSETHTFVADGHSFFDSNTNGEIVPADRVPECLDDFRVLNWYRIRPASK
jgi:hypothetical protein